MIYLLWFAVLVIALVLYHRQIYSRFQKYGVKYFKPIPLLGNAKDMIMRKKHVAQDYDDLYSGFPGERFAGRYEFMKPVVCVRDLDLIKKIAVKDFEHFVDHPPMVDKNMDPIFGRNLFSLNSQEWKDMRSTLSPAFTSSKMRSMVPFMLEVSDMMMTTLKEKMNSSGGYVDIEVKDLTTRYANDVIASCAFGLKVNSHSDVNNEFYTVGKETASSGFRRILVFLGYSSFPKLMSSLGIKLLSERTSNFFRRIILDTMKEREAKNIIRQDMIHLLMKAKKGSLTHDEKPDEDEDAGFATVEESHIGQSNVNRDWSDDDLVAQAVLFFIAGFETVSTAMTFILYELAVHPEVQERLAQEIKEHDIKTGGKFDFNSIQNLTYLDMIVSEVLRLWPPAVGMGRLCVKDYNLGKPNSKAAKDYIIRKGEVLTVPVWSLHHNAEYFPEPYKFDPERFSEENKHKIKPLTYSPFGIGPRNCIGSRFALCEIKVMIYNLLQQIKVSPCEKTQIPAKMAQDTFNVRLQGGHWLRFTTRD